MNYLNVKMKHILGIRRRKMTNVDFGYAQSPISVLFFAERDQYE